MKCLDWSMVEHLCVYNLFIRPLVNLQKHFPSFTDGHGRDETDAGFYIEE